MKQNVKLGAVLLCMVLWLAACGSGSGQPAGDGQPPGGVQAGPGNGQAASTQASDDATSKAPQTRKVSTVKGEIEIPVEPQRVIGLSVVYPEFLYALGITPVAVQNYHSEYPSYLTEPFKDTVKMGIGRTPNFEAILAAQPDVILAPEWWSANDYDQLSEIAPTLLLPAHDDWRDELRSIGVALDRQEQAEQVIADLAAKEAEVRGRLDELVGDETVVYMRVMAKEIVVHSENIDRGSFIHKQLGLKPLDNFPKAERAMPISLEMLPDFDADHIIVQLDDDSKDEVQERFKEATDNSLWKKMKAVRNGHVYMVGGKEYFNLGMSPLADRFAMEDILQAFEQRLK